MNKEKSKLYKKVFNSPEGKKVVRDLMECGMIFGQTHVPNDPYSSAFNEGQRRIVLRLLSFLKPEEMLDLYNSKENVITNSNEGLYE